MSDAADLEGSLVGPLADADGNKLLVLDVHRPRERYVNCVVNRATGNAVIDGVIASVSRQSISGDTAEAVISDAFRVFVCRLDCRLRIYKCTPHSVAMPSTMQ